VEPRAQSGHRRCKEDHEGEGAGETQYHMPDITAETRSIVPSRLPSLIKSKCLQWLSWARGAATYEQSSFQTRRRYFASASMA
jgi:hypothetical protein